MGTTHVSLALSNYLCSKLGKKTAYVELNDSHDALTFTSGKMLSECPLYGIDFYASVLPSELERIKKENYDWIILDMGRFSASLFKEFMQCSHRLVIGHFSPWKIEQYHNWLQNQKKTNVIHPEDVILLGNLGLENQLQQFNQKYHCKIQAIPYLQNPFHLSVSDWSFFQKLLERMRYTTK